MWERPEEFAYTEKDFTREGGKRGQMYVDSIEDKDEQTEITEALQNARPNGIFSRLG